MSLSSSAAAVVPAMISPTVAMSEEGATLSHNLSEMKLLENKEVKSADYMPITDSKNVERFVNDYFADIPVMVAIAKCESRFRHFDSKGQVLRGEITPLDRGVMQINLYFHEKTATAMGLDVHDLDDNVKYARYLYEKQGAKPWMSSSACWAKFDNTEIAKR